MKKLFFAGMTVLIFYLYQYNLKIANDIVDQWSFRQVSAANVNMPNSHDLLREIILNLILVSYDAAARYLDRQGIVINEAFLEIDIYFNIYEHNDTNIIIYDLNSNHQQLLNIYKKSCPSLEIQEIINLVVPIVKALLLRHIEYCQKVET